MVASTKKSTAKKPVAKKAPVKKAPVKKAAAKKAPARKKTVSASAKMESFKLYRESPSEFRSFRVTRQTIYWTILLAFIMVTQLWILKIQLDIAEITNALTTMQ